MLATELKWTLDTTIPASTESTMNSDDELLIFDGLLGVLDMMDGKCGTDSIVFGTDERLACIVG
jgi:hypothetical protein